MKYLRYVSIVVVFVLLLTNCGGNSAPATPGSPQGPSVGVVGYSFTFKAATTDPDDNNISYQFDWGDGSLSPWSILIPSGDTASLAHSYTQNGTYEVLVHAEDENNKLSEWSEPHILIIGHPDSVIDIITGINRPSSIAVLPNSQYIYAPSFSTHSTYVISTSNNTVTATIPAGRSSDAVSLPDGQYVYVTPNLGSDIYSIRTSDNTVVDTIQTSSMGYSKRAAVRPDGVYLYVVMEYEGVQVIRTSDNAIVDTVDLSTTSNFGIAVHPDGNFAYVASNRLLTVIRLSDNTVLYELEFDDHLHSIAVLPDGEYLYVSAPIVDRVYVVRTLDYALVSTIPVGDYPMSLDVHPSGQFVYVPNRDSDNVSVIYTPTNTVVQTIPVGDRPVCARALPNGEYIYVANDGSNNISVIGR